MSYRPGCLESFIVEEELEQFIKTSSWTNATQGEKKNVLIRLVFKLMLSL